MRLGHVAGVVSVCVVMLAAAVRPRADEGSAPASSGTQQSTVASPPTKRDLAPLDAALEREEHRIEAGVAPNGGRAAMTLERGPATAATATAVENAVRGPGAEPPMWGDPFGIDLRAAAVAIHTAVAPRPEPPEAARPVAHE